MTDLLKKAQPVRGKLRPREEKGQTRVALGSSAHRCLPIQPVGVGEIKAQMGKGSWSYPVWRICVATSTSCKQVFSNSDSRNQPQKGKDWRPIPPRKWAGVPWSPSSLMIPRPSAQDAPISCGPSAAGPRDTATGREGGGGHRPLPSGGLGWRPLETVKPLPRGDKAAGARGAHHLQGFRGF